MTGLSCYVLTRNSERLLVKVLESVRAIADEIVIVDSGSTDSTLEIARSFSARIMHRPFDNFRDQRVYAESLCVHQWVLALDSDEVLSAGLVAHILDLKRTGFQDADGKSQADGFAIRRDWYFLGRRVRNFYPVKAPDYVVRLFDAGRLGHAGSRKIHEAVVTDGKDIKRIEMPIEHYSCAGVGELYAKVDLYVGLAVQDMRERGIRGNWAMVLVYPWLVWLLWYVAYGGWRDGSAGLVLANYARHTIYLKNLRLLLDAPDSPDIRDEGNPRKNR